MAPMVRLHLPGEAFSVYAFYDETHTLIGWYGNLEAPFVRTKIGIDTQDHALDVVADPAGRWHWKDEVEFARRLELGLDTPDHQTSVRRAGEDFIARLCAGDAPFDQRWAEWRPPPNWEARSLPPSWKDALGAHFTSG
jgi:predicted RNA-binding protein associated with RNAse of E/G family